MLIYKFTLLCELHEHSKLASVPVNLICEDSEECCMEYIFKYIATHWLKSFYLIDKE